MSDAYQSYVGYTSPEFLKKSSEMGKERKQAVYRLMGVSAGQRILDMGCGPASDTLALAELVGLTGEVVGIDHDEAMITLANEKAAAAGVNAYVHHLQADATKVPCETGYFDAVHSERLFQHLKNPEVVLDELVRVVKPGGCIVIIDVDYSNSLALHTPFTDLMWRMRRFKTDRYNSGYIAQQIWPYMKVRGLEPSIEFQHILVLDYQTYRFLFRSDEVDSEMVTAGIVTSEELQQFHNDLQQRSLEGTFFGVGTLFTTVGRKPQ